MPPVNAPIPIDPLGAASAAINLGGGIYNAIATHNQNIKNRDFAKEMYAMQRADALADWERQNLYNSPEQQMERYRKAGLNPNLIYGNMANMPAVRSTSADTPKGEAPQFYGNPLAAYQDYAMKNVQTDLLKVEQQKREDQRMLIQAQVVNQLLNADKTALGNEFTRQNWETALNTGLKELENLQVRAAQGWQSLEQKEKLFPVQMANQILEGKKKVSSTAKDYSDIKVNAKRITEISKRIEKMGTEIDHIKLKNFDQNKRNGMLDDIHQLIINQKDVESGKKSLQDQQKELNDIKIRWHGAGLSETFISDLINEAIGFGKSIAPKNIIHKKSK